MVYSSYYEILGVSEDSVLEEIKTAFRKLAMVYHPDKNGNSSESKGRFILISNAYKILSDSIKRREYDAYLRGSLACRKRKKKAPARRTAPAKKSTLPVKAGEVFRSNEELLNHLNFLLWDIEDVISGQHHRDAGKSSSGFYILKILTFIDKWVLTPAGYPDYFMEARKMKRTDPTDYNNLYGRGHRPYVNVTDYFYDIRKKMDRFLERGRMNDLLKKNPGYEFRLIDCIVEAQNYAVHYLSYLLKKNSKAPEEIPPFDYSNPGFSC